MFLNWKRLMTNRLSSLVRREDISPHYICRENIVGYISLMLMLSRIMLTGETSVEEFIGRSEENPYLEIDNSIGKPCAKRIHMPIVCLFNCWNSVMKKVSPMNDLNYARAIREIVRKDLYYKGNIDKALNEVAKLSAMNHR